MHLLSRPKASDNYANPNKSSKIRTKANVAGWNTVILCIIYENPTDR
jgi:hypothetical protein